MQENKDIVLKPLLDEDIPLFEKWLDKEYIYKWLCPGGERDREAWLDQINNREGQYDFIKHFIVYYDGHKIGYCLYVDCFFLKDMEEEGHDFESLYGDVMEKNHTFEIGYLIGEEAYLNKGISKVVIRQLEERIIVLGGREISADPSEENIFSIKALLKNGFREKGDGDYRKRIGDDCMIIEIRTALRELSDEKTKKASDRFFKKGEQALVYGVKTVEVYKVGKEFTKQISGKPKQEVFGICEELWKSGYFEEAVIACMFAESLYEEYAPSDFEIFERWVKEYVNNWADCDTLCNHTIGSFVMKYPAYVDRLKKWARSSERFVKRAAAVTLIIPARKGLFLSDIFEIADILLLDKDDLVQKGYGWMLKAASQTYQEEVFNYVVSKKSVMPRTALRYAIEKMPPELRAEAMKKG